MLPPASRLRNSTAFSVVIRDGRRARSGAVVVHQRARLSDGAPAVVGLIVSKAVGGSVVRHRVSRRLRAQLAQRLAALPPASGTVIRALPAAGTATSAALGVDLDRALGKLAARR